ncbi:MAG: 1,4-dihydroxy-6-naphthoate synthase [Bacteroidetes bacterium]|nr:MAG: 1,4-dihydroxy-6-naphthoate synthase [Bacteroidota bacterium]
MINNPILTLGFSPCPNDTFIFDALVHAKIDCQNLSFKTILADVEGLNQKAFSSELDITKLSFFAYGFLSDKYQLLDSGAALGKGVGPLLVSKKHYTNPEKEIKSVAIPGKYTTANFLFSLFYPDIAVKKEMIFSSIEDAILNGEVDAGVIIHENRFTYEKKGLRKIADLGTEWENKTNMPIPLGGIAVRRSLSDEIKSTLNLIVRNSIEYAFANPESSTDYIRKHAQEMDEDVIRQHIDLYVNESSISLGTNGREAINLLFDKAGQLGLIEKINEPIFLKTKEMYH